MRVKVVKIKRAQFAPIQIEIKYEENIVKDRNGNALFAIPRNGFIAYAHANVSDIKFDWFMDKLYGEWRRVVWD